MRLKIKKVSKMSKYKTKLFLNLLAIFQDFKRSFILFRCRMGAHNSLLPRTPNNRSSFPPQMDMVRTLHPQLSPSKHADIRCTITGGSWFSTKRNEPRPCDGIHGPYPTVPRPNRATQKPGRRRSRIQPTESYCAFLPRCSRSERFWPY